ncbi:lantibiotic dehydratase [Halostreptopolyspora alba]|uniref:Lantibiotic dehydratase N-terminal domain-containing protein n=1 Tax=Halostreptopolyspora alba TaxID=2487137 RepID=A0A3N0EDV0_9ACTN|nr:hypothetical protein EFW17_05540 [Nocardiopsaceae bacterium YIM 96095]
MITDTGPRLIPPPVARVSGLALSALERLRFPDSAAAATEHLRRRDLLTAEGVRLSTELYDVVSDAAAALRPRLVGLRRSLYQARPPATAEWNDQVAAAVPDGLRAEIETWLRQMRAHRQGLTALEDTIARESAGKRDELRELTRDPRLLRGLAQSSPTLLRVAEKWHRTPNAQPKRKSLTRLATYVARGTVKTSPFSTFTTVGFAHLTPEAPSTRLSDDTGPTSLLEIDWLVVNSARQALLDDPELRQVAPVRVNPSASRAGGRVTCLSPVAGEPIVTLPATAAVTQVLDTVTAEPGISLDALLERLSSGETKTEAVVAYVDKLIDSGLLEVQIPVSDQAERPLRELARWLRANSTDGGGSTAEQLERLDTQVGHGTPLDDAAGDPPEHRELLDSAAALSETLGSVAFTRGTDGKIPAHETVLHRRPVVECAEHEWESLRGDLDAIRHWLAVHSPTLPLRALLAEEVESRFGAGSRTPFLEIHQMVQRELEAGTESGGRLATAMRAAVRADPLEEYPSDTQRLRQLRELRDAATRTVLDAPQQGAEITVAADTIRELAAGWPSWVRVPGSVVFWAQQLGAGQRLVLNASATGPGKSRNRIQHQLQLATGERVELDVGAEADHTAELRGAFGYTFNRREALTRYEIDYPGVVSTAPAERRIPMRDLVVAHDPASGLLSLESAGLGHPIRAANLGMLVEKRLPPAARLLNNLFGDGFLKYPATAILTSTVGADGLDPERVFFPRITVGGVVIRRAVWYLRHSRVPVRTTGEGHGAYLCRLLDWLDSHGMPRQCYLRVLDDTVVGNRDGERWAAGKNRKPLYVDFTNLFLVDAFENALAGPTTAAILLEEALPTPADGLPDHNGDRRTVEFVLEMSDRGVHRA